MDIFSESDIKTLLKTVTGGQSSSSALPRPPAVPRTVELVSGGLILEHHAKAIIENSIFSEKDASRYHSYSVSGTGIRVTELL